LIIGILSSGALPQYTMAVEKARATEAIQNVAMLEKQLDLYRLENGSPASSRISYRDMSLPVELAGVNFENDGTFSTKFFNYNVWVESNNAEIEVMRVRDGDYYTLLSSQKNWTTSNKVGNWYRSCITQLNDFGRKACKQLEGQGWTYYEGEI